MFHDMQVEEIPHSVNTMNLQQPKVLVRPHQAESTKGKNVVVGDERPTLQKKILTREVICETSPDGKKTLKITVKPSGPGGQGSVAIPESQPSRLPAKQAVRPAGTGGLTGSLPCHRRSNRPTSWTSENAETKASGDRYVESECDQEQGF
jgi:hypothetical protein